MAPFGKRSVSYEAYDQKARYCGRNLAPAYWGRGIAVVVLLQLFDDLFDDRQIDIALSDCFSDNQRCIRVLEKLDYEPVGISPLERLCILTLNRCLHWIRRFRLTCDGWYLRPSAVSCC